jgi:hypothetical protein
MPFKIRKIPNKPCYRVYNAKTKKIHAKCTTKINAKRQLRLLNAVSFGNFIPKLNKSKRIRH